MVHHTFISPTTPTAQPSVTYTVGTVDPGRISNFPNYCNNIDITVPLPFMNASSQAPHCLLMCTVSGGGQRGFRAPPPLPLLPGHLSGSGGVPNVNSISHIVPTPTMGAAVHFVLGDRQVPNPPFLPVVGPVLVHLRTGHNPQFLAPLPVYHPAVLPPNIPPVVPLQFIHPVVPPPNLPYNLTSPQLHMNPQIPMPVDNTFVRI